MIALLGALFGLVAGSFIAALVIRWPQGRSLFGRSQCDGCGKTLGVMELLPLISFVAQRGQCRSCGGVIDRRHIWIELAAALIGGLALTVQPNFFGLGGALFGWILLALGALDWDHFWLPNRLTAILAVTGAIGAIFSSSPIDNAIGGILGFVVLWLIAAAYRTIRNRDGLGAGDPKLFGGIGLWLGWQSLPIILLLASSFGLITALAMHVKHQNIDAKSRLPFGTFLALAAFPVWLVLQS